MFVPAVSLSHYTQWRRAQSRGQGRWHVKRRAHAVSTFWGAPLDRQALLQRRPRLKGSGALRTSANLLGDGGFLGVGAPEVVVVVIMAWIFLGPTKLYETAQYLGRLIGDLRRAAQEARDGLTDSLGEEYYEAQEQLLKVRDEFNDAIRGEKPRRLGGTADSDEDAADADASVGTDAAAELAESLSVTEPKEHSKNGLEQDIVTGGGASRTNFLEQLRRLNDPQQAPPVPEYAEAKRQREQLQSASPEGEASADGEDVDIDGDAVEALAQQISQLEETLQTLKKRVYSMRRRHTDKADVR
ncbi:hypothetical protein CDCA_CDCA18G4521 [Cyanidium caldarium]|uniref:Uncharacterized protein n=1 Tax=Cyanidium caldarium TaxID=2771 RepID=A0AAV9J2H5_CYACA|nr:hypothetical protein CDCA_CDCA18G4521 [Cyanidium caldarium]